MHYYAIYDDILYTQYYTLGNADRRTHMHNIHTHIVTHHIFLYSIIVIYTCYTHIYIYSDSHIDDITHVLRCLL